MDFTNHPLRTELIDNRESIGSRASTSIIDSYTTKLRVILRDQTLSAGFVAKCLKHLSEADINDFADYAVRKGNHPGRAFVGLCEKTMRYRSLN